MVRYFENNCRNTTAIIKAALKLLSWLLLLDGGYFQWAIFQNRHQTKTSRLDFQLGSSVGISMGRKARTKWVCIFSSVSGQKLADRQMTSWQFSFCASLGMQTWTQKSTVTYLTHCPDSSLIAAPGAACAHLTSRCMLISRNWSSLQRRASIV